MKQTTLIQEGHGNTKETKQCDQKINDNISFQSPKSPHFWWIISLMSVVIIVLLAYILWGRMCCADKIMEYISYASVLLSITLSVFAIMYTYESNSQVQRQFDKINSAADSIMFTSDKLSRVGGDLTENIALITQKLDAISSTQETMKTTIEAMKNTSRNSYDSVISNVNNTL